MKILKIIFRTLLFLALYFSTEIAKAQNPIHPGIGLCDPQVRIYNNRAYLYATHDSAFKSKGFVMNNWWIWSSVDLVTWKYESTLRPEDTYYGRSSNQCWATDAISGNGKYYFYFSRGSKEIGVVVSDSPTGPWKDLLGKPLISQSITPTEARDPGILQTEDSTCYIIFGVWDFYIARLNPDLISLAETPRKIVLNQKYGPYGAGKTDDKPFLYKYNNKYYLSWGCYYSMADNLYGPYIYKGSIIIKERTDTVFQNALTYDRHGSFFEFHNQSYFICNDQSFPGSNSHFRNSIISYIHYRDNGEIEPVFITHNGVDQYNKTNLPIQAEDYSNASKIIKRQSPHGGFEVQNIHNGSILCYSSVRGLKKNTTVSFRISSFQKFGTVNVHSDGPNGPVLGKCKVSGSGGWDIYKTIKCKLKNKPGDTNICLVFRGNSEEFLRLDWLDFK